MASSLSDKEQAAALNCAAEVSQSETEDSHED